MSVAGIDPIPVVPDAGPVPTASLPPKSLGDDDATPPRDSGPPEETGPIAPVDAGPVVVYEYPLEAGADANADWIRQVAIDDGGLYWYNTELDQIVRADLDGGSPSVVFDGLEQADQFAVTGQYIWHSANKGDGEMKRKTIGGADDSFGTGKVAGCVSLDPDGTKVYGADYEGSRIVYVPAGGGPKVDLLMGGDGISHPWGFAATPETYFFTVDEGSISARARDGGTTTTIYDGGANVQCLTVEGDLIWWPSFNDGKIHRAKIDGSEHVVLAEDQLQPTLVALAPGAIYWNSGNKIMRLAR